MGKGSILRIIITMKNYRISARRLFKKLPFKIILAVFALIILLVVVFFSRKPVVLVTGKAFTVLYGEKRSRFKQISLSLRLFRPVKTIAIAEGAGADLVTQGALSLSRQPFAVFFPYRYREAAWRYQNNRPGSRVVVLAGRKARENDYGSENNSQGSTAISEAMSGLPLWINTDSETDLYRAGALAGIYTQHEKQNRGIALFYEGLNYEEKAAFVAGLDDQQWDGSPSYSPDLTETDLSCAVILENFRFGEEGKAGSLILFTWMDPALAPRKTLAIFDDSPWAQISPAMDIIKKGRHGTLIPSEITILRGDKTKKDVYNEINRLKILKKRVENADN
ncbi:MAG: hypothetical protein FWG29_01285 [Treponema sp.]|nr:hypothetical protein [Treponema sp.]